MDFYRIYSVCVAFLETAKIPSCSYDGVRANFPDLATSRKKYR